MESTIIPFVMTNDKADRWCCVALRWSTSSDLASKTGTRLALALVSREPSFYALEGLLRGLMSVLNGEGSPENRLTRLKAASRQLVMCVPMPVPGASVAIQFVGGQTIASSSIDDRITAASASTVVVSRPSVHEHPKMIETESLRTLFRLLPVHAILAAFGALITQQRIVIHIDEQHIGLTTIVAEALTSLLYPFEWSAEAYTPLLPYNAFEAFGADVLDKPGFYIFGISTSMLMDFAATLSGKPTADGMTVSAAQVIVEQKGVVVINLNTGTVAVPARGSGTDSGDRSGLDFPEIPQALLKPVQAALQPFCKLFNPAACKQDHCNAPTFRTSTAQTAIPAPYFTHTISGASGEATASVGCFTRTNNSCDAGSKVAPIVLSRGDGADDIRLTLDQPLVAASSSALATSNAAKAPSAGIDFSASSVQHAFLQFMLSIVGDYATDEWWSYQNAQASHAQDDMRSEEGDDVSDSAAVAATPQPAYIAIEFNPSAALLVKPENQRPFFQTLYATQAFVNFCNERVKVGYMQVHSVVYFEAWIRTLENGGQRVPFLQPGRHLHELLQLGDNDTCSSEASATCPQPLLLVTLSGAAAPLEDASESTSSNSGSNHSYSDLWWAALDAQWESIAAASAAEEATVHAAASSGTSSNGFTSPPQRSSGNGRGLTSPQYASPSARFRSVAARKRSSTAGGEFVAAASENGAGAGSSAVDGRPVSKVNTVRDREVAAAATDRNAAVDPTQLQPQPPTTSGWFSWLSGRSGSTKAVASKDTASSAPAEVAGSGRREALGGIDGPPALTSPGSLSAELAVMESIGEEDDQPIDNDASTSASTEVSSAVEAMQRQPPQQQPSNASSSEAGSANADLTAAAMTGRKRPADEITASSSSSEFGNVDEIPRPAASIHRAPAAAAAPFASPSAIARSKKAAGSASGGDAHHAHVALFISPNARGTLAKRLKVTDHQRAVAAVGGTGAAAMMTSAASASIACATPSAAGQLDTTAPVEPFLSPGQNVTMMQMSAFVGDTAPSVNGAVAAVASVVDEAEMQDSAAAIATTATPVSAVVATESSSAGVVAASIDETDAAVSDRDGSSLDVDAPMDDGRAADDTAMGAESESRAHDAASQPVDVTDEPSAAVKDALIAQLRVDLAHSNDARMRVEAQNKYLTAENTDLKERIRALELLLQAPQGQPNELVDLQEPSSAASQPLELPSHDDDGADNHNQHPFKATGASLSFDQTFNPGEIKPLPVTLARQRMQKIAADSAKWVGACTLTSSAADAMDETTPPLAEPSMNEAAVAPPPSSSSSAVSITTVAAPVAASKLLQPGFARARQAASSAVEASSPRTQAVSQQRHTAAGTAASAAGLMSPTRAPMSPLKHNANPASRAPAASKSSVGGAAGGAKKSAASSSSSIAAASSGVKRA